MISIVIPVKDGGGGLAHCLDRIGAQELDEDVEIVVVDSGSTDDSVAIARAHGGTVYEIAPSEFTHGGSRNFGAQHARGEVLVFISQDAYPSDDLWLGRLTGALRGRPDVAGSYGRQLPHAGARPPEAFFLDFLYGPTPRRQRAASAAELTMSTTLFSNVNAAIPRPIWEQFPFAEDIIMSEDQEWSQRVLLAGFTIVYEPAAAVRHSHNYTLGAAFQRFFDSGVSAERAYLAGKKDSTRVLRARAFDYAWRELRWLTETKQKRWIPYAVVYETTKLLGLVMGANHGRLPLSVKRRMSGLRSHWDQPF